MQAHGREAAVVVPVQTREGATRVEAQAIAKEDEVVGVATAVVVAEVEEAMIEVVGEDEEAVEAVFTTRTPTEPQTRKALLTSLLLLQEESLSTCFELSRWRGELQAAAVSATHCCSAYVS